MPSLPRTLIARVTFALALCAVGTTGCQEVDEKLATSPLIGAERIEVRGSGVVQEAIAVRRYVYMRLDSSAPGVWHVVTGKAPKPGERVTYRGYARISDFHSPALNRRFDTLIFASTKTPTLAKNTR